MTARQADLLHPRMTVVPVIGRSAPAIPAAPGCTVVGPAELAWAVGAAAERRRSRLREDVAALDQQRQEIASEMAAADAATSQRREEHDALLAAAAWCESLPAHLDELRAARDGAETVLFERLRASRAAGRDLERVLEQRAVAGVVVADARSHLALLHPGAPGGAAGDQLAAQTEAVEARLAVAEAEAHLSIAHAARAVFEAEQELADLAERRRGELAQLAALIEGLLVEERPPRGDDPLDHVDAVAAHLRSLAATYAGGVADAEAALERGRVDHDELVTRIESVRVSIDQIAVEDAAESLMSFAGDADGGAIVLDSVVADEDDRAGGGLLQALEVVDGLPPLVLVTADPSVLAWAIDLPAEVGLVAPPSVLDVLAAPTPAAPAAPDGDVVSAEGGQP